MPDEKGKTKAAAGYIRESTEEQVEFSPEAQRKALLKYAELNGYILDERHIYSDAGISGKKAEKRPAFQRMIAAAKSKERPFDAILVWKYSRFARNQEESIVYKSMLKRDGVEVISITEPIVDGPFGSLIERIIEWMDEYYSIRLAEEVKKGMTEKARRGGLQSVPPFGYRAEANKLVPIPEEADCVREIFRRFLDGQGLMQIAKWLNGLGIVTHRGNGFENRTVEYILRNPTYIGKLRWNPSGRTRRDFGNQNIILADALHEPLIDWETWEAAQRRMDAVKARIGYKARPSDEWTDWPSGIIRCASCGGTLIFTKPHYCKCGNYIRAKCQTSQHIHAGLLKKAVMERLNFDTASSLPLKETVLRAHEKTPFRPEQPEVRAEALERKKARLRDAYLNGAESLEEYRSRKLAYDTELADIRERMEKSGAQPEAHDTAAIRRAISEALLTMDSPLATTEEKHNAVLSVVETCTWDKSANQLTIVYRTPV